MNIAHVISMKKYISSIYLISKKLNETGFGEQKKKLRKEEITLIYT